MQHPFTDPATGQQPSTPHQYQSDSRRQHQYKPKTVSGIVGLIVAVLGLTLSWVPIVNNIAFFFAIISGILGIIAMVATRSAGKRSARWAAVATLTVTTLTISVVLLSQAFYGKAIDEVSKAIDTSTPAVGKTSSSGTPDVTKFGSVATFKDGSTLTCSKPSKFKRSEFAAGGENAKIFLKSQCTFTNRSGQTFKPGLSSGSMSAGGAEGESVFQEGFDTPDNPVLNGRSVTWRMGYGVISSADVQLTVRMGFLDYDEVIFA